MNNNTYLTSPSYIKIVGLGIGFFSSIFSSPVISAEFETYSTQYSTVEYSNTEKAKVTEAYLSVEKKLNEIKSSFKLNISELAEILNVSRPTIYSWIKGEIPKKPENIEHIDFIRFYASKFKDLNLIRPDNFIKRFVLVNNENINLFKSLQKNIDIEDSFFQTIKKIDVKEELVRTSNNSLHTMKNKADLFINKYVS